MTQSRLVDQILLNVNINLQREGSAYSRSEGIFESEARRASNVDLTLLVCELGRESVKVAMLEGGCGDGFVGEHEMEIDASAVDDNLSKGRTKLSRATASSCLVADSRTSAAGVQILACTSFDELWAASRRHRSHRYSPGERELLSSSAAFILVG